MSAFQHVLVGLDLSEAKAAVILARACQVADLDDIEVLHVCHHDHRHHEDYPVGSFGSSEALDEAVKKGADRTLEKFCEPFGITRHEVISGQPVDVIHRCANERADLVVVGSHGRHGFRTLFGSTSNAVIHATPCDVLTVHISEHDAQEPENYRRILVAVDLTDESLKLMDHAQRIAERCGSALAVCHVYATSDETERRHARQSLAQLCSLYGVDSNCMVITTGAPASVIHGTAKEMAVDLIVVGAHGKHGAELLRGSTANAVLHNAACDALAVRISTD